MRLTLRSIWLVGFVGSPGILLVVGFGLVEVGWSRDFCVFLELFYTQFSNVLRAHFTGPPPVFGLRCVLCSLAAAWWAGVPVPCAWLGVLVCVFCRDSAVCVSFACVARLALLLLFFHLSCYWLVFICKIVVKCGYICLFC